MNKEYDELKRHFLEKAKQKNFREESIEIAKISATNTKDKISTFKEMIAMVDDGKTITEIIQYVYHQLKQDDRVPIINKK